MVDVIFRPETKKDFEQLDVKVAQRIINKIKWLSKNFKFINPQPLTAGFKGKYKLRIGDYRVIYSINEEKKQITIYMVGHRNNIYK